MSKLGLSDGDGTVKLYNTHQDGDVVRWAANFSDETDQEISLELDALGVVSRAHLLRVTRFQPGQALPSAHRVTLLSHWPD